MPRPLRYIPENALVEVTCRTLQGRYLLRPSRDLNEIVVGILARAAARYDVRVCAFVFLSNHAHLLLQPADAQQLSSFMAYVNGNLAREAGRLHQWRQRFWGHRYHAIVVSDEELAHTARLHYLLEQGCKEDLVRRPQDWPGASSVDALLSGKPLPGLWFDRTSEYKARLRGERPAKYAFAEEQTLELAPLPAWRHLRPEERQRRALAIVRQIEADTRQRLRAAGRSPMGRRRILAQDPHDRPRRFVPTPAPRFHAYGAAARKALELAYRVFVSAYREAAQRLRQGARDVLFPTGSFPPPMPFRQAAAEP